MAETEFVWTVVPGGSDPDDGDLVNLTVHVGIKLTATSGGEGVLGDHPEFLDGDGAISWPPDPDLTFDLTVDDGGTPVPLPAVPVDASAYDRAYWADVFSPTTRVTDFVQRDLSALDIHTYPAAKITQVIQALYAAAFPLGQDGLPTGPGLLGVGLADLSFRGREGAIRRDAATQQLTAALTTAGVVDTTAASDPGFDVFQLLDYYAPQDLSAFQTADGTPIPPRPPAFSFNEALVGLHAEPVLQRLFGLVFELQLSRDEHLDRFQNAVSLGLRAVPVSDRLADAVHRSPRTVADYVHDPSGAFAPQPRPTDPLIADGYLRMEPGAGIYAVNLVDPNEGMKLSTAAGNVEANQTLPDVTKPAGEALPALRSGLFVSQNGLAKDLKDRFAATPPSTAAVDGMDLYAEDLMKGFLVDIRRTSPETGPDPWRSDAFRSSTYTFPNLPDVTVDDEEGHASRGVTQRLDGNPDLYAGEVIYPWEGFPVGLPMPGRALNADPADPQQAVDPEVNPDGVPTGDLPYTISHGRPATHGFTRLLCGDAYAFRARVRWLDGTNVSPDDGDDSHATDATSYLRTEPVPPVDLYPTEPYVPGEGQAVVVLRGNHDTPPEKPFVQRLALPKRVAFTDVLKTRLFDVPAPGDPSRTVIDPGRYADLVTRDGYRVGDDPAVSTMPDQPDQVYVDPSTFSTQPLPFLPDPLVDGVALHLLNGVTPGSYAFRFGGDFPDPVPFWVRVEEGTNPPNVEVAGDVITVQLRKGDKVRAAHSALYDERFEAWLALLDWASPSQAQLDAIREGRHTAITPWAELTLVYAVRQPLELAIIGEPLRLLRPKGATWVQLEAPIAFNRRSTDQIDVTAAWDEYVDAGPDTDPPTSAAVPPLEVVTDAAITINVDHAEGLDDAATHFGESGTANRIEFGDTKHRDLRLGTTVTSRYAEHFTQRHLANYAAAGSTITLPGVGSEGLVPGWVTVRTPAAPPDSPPANPVDRAETLVPARLRNPMSTPSSPFDPSEYHPGHYLVDDAAGEVQMLPAGTFGSAAGLYEPAEGAELRITYLVPPITRAWPEEGPSTLAVTVPSSARPSAPVIRYVIPTFGWATTSTQDGSQVSSMRDGRGLRIYLERPWWTSGGGELLGVLLWAAAEGTGTPAEEMVQNHPLFPYVTQWGEDPLFDAGALPSRYPPSTTFTNRVTTSNTLRVDGTRSTFPDADELVVAAGHEVTYDADRDLWFTDLVLEAATAYTPFIRLALARYQPDSIGGCHLSPVVLAEFAQLAPDRSATVVVDAADPRQLTISLTGPGPSEPGQQGTPRGRVQVTVEERRPNPELYDDDEMTWTPVTTPILLSGSRSAQVTTWTGTVQVPATDAAQEWRIVIEEFETHPIEPFEQNQSPGVGGRLVHTDTIVVTAGGPDQGTGPGGGGGSGGGAPGPAPEFDPPEDEIDPLDPAEIFEVEVNRIEIGPGPVIEEFATSIGQVAVELQEVTGQGTLRVEVIDAGRLGAPAGLRLGNGIDVSTQGLSHEGAVVTMPQGFEPTAENGLGARLFHGVGGGLADVTTGVDGQQVSGFAATLSPFATGEYVGLQRLAGAGRVETAAAISQATFTGPLPRVYLATAGAFPDALTAGPRAAVEGVPILLVGEDLPAATAAELDRLTPNEIVLLGGTAAIGAAVDDAVRGVAPGATVRRIAGDDRFATAAAISAEGFGGGADVVYVATGGSFPDALGGGAAAARDGAPMLLVTPDDVPEATTAEVVRLGPSRIVVLGGTAVVSDAVADQLAELTGATVERLAGPDRYATGAAVAATFDPSRTVFVATGEAFPDALAGVPAAGAEDAVLVLTRPDELPEPSRTQIERLDPDRIVVLGGDAAVAEGLEIAFAEVLLA